ncbi:inactive protein RESTRICTED TEV MOVEMENT 1-like [Nicotiana tabacum]|uniref:Inactive protein RESTRICTED TEV MOVEMENT 1-like n=1 Tax=Nicotiana tabacum TaxID=4097 RepID=A0A1S4BB24_TOBAC|nr:inactive protein RESTRICTED TEV MOVEMENT 1-like [Nicotiana tomentosiformis]XP_016486094.1 PREDICTED: inactive protein RESTRICTED TEV MOVEMENT 1-like [Nicotiana tabacum]
MDMIKVSPVGKCGRHIWDEKGRDQIAGIFISYAEDIVFSLQFMFYENGDLIMPGKHGSRSHNQRGDYCAIVFDYPSEFLISIGGSFEQMNKKLTVLSSIKFGTNKGSYGPFGTPSTENVDKTDFFNFQIGNYRLFGGFYGSQNDDSIESIGFYVKAIPSSIINLKDSTVNVKKEKDEED